MSRKKGIIQIVSIRASDYGKNCVVFNFGNETYEWFTSSNWKKASLLTYMPYHIDINVSFTDMGESTYGIRRIATNVRIINSTE